MTVKKNPLLNRKKDLRVEVNLKIYIFLYIPIGIMAFGCFKKAEVFSSRKTNLLEGYLGSKGGDIPHCL